MKITEMELQICTVEGCSSPAEITAKEIDASGKVVRVIRWCSKHAKENEFRPVRVYGPAFKERSGAAYTRTQ